MFTKLFRRGVGKFVFWACWGGVLVLCCRCVQIPRSSWNPPNTHVDLWVRNYDTAEAIQRIDFLINEKGSSQQNTGLIFKETLRRLQSGEDLSQRQRALEGEYSSNLEHLNSLLRLEKGDARVLYESCCVLIAELSLFDERKS